MFRQLLVPLDGSRAAEQVLPVARKLALSSHATVHLVDVVPLPLSWTAAGAYLPQSVFDAVLASDQEAARSTLDAARARLAASGLSVSTVVMLGEVVPQLLLYEREHQIAIVVLDVHDHPGPARLTLGSVTMRLLRHGTAPLLLVHGCVDPACLAHAVVPLDGSEAHEEVLLPLVALAPAVVKRVSLLRVVSHEEQRLMGARYLAGIAQRMADQGLQIVERRVVVGCPATAIRELAGTEHLVVMATHAHSTPQHWLPSSVAERVVRQNGAAVLLVRTGGTAHGLLDAEHGRAAARDALAAVERR